MARTTPITQRDDVTFGAPRRRRTLYDRARARVGGTFAPYFYVSSFFLIFFGFFAYPVGYSFYVSLQHWSGIGPMRPVGWDNYTFVLADTYWWSALQITGILWLMVVPVGIAISLLVAVAWNRAHVRGRQILVVAYLMPAVIPIVAISVVFRILYDPTAGPIAVLMGDLHLAPIPWLTSDAWGKPAVALVRQWESVGLGALFFSAALQNISAELYDAAAVDGCGPIRAFFAITIPLLVRTMVFLGIFGTIIAVGLIAEPQLIESDGGPGGSTTTVGLYLYHLLVGFDYGTASAVSFLMTVITMIVSIILFVVTRRWTAD